MLITLVCLEHLPAVPRPPPVRFGLQAFLLLSFQECGVFTLPIDPSLLGFQVSGDLGDLTLYTTRKGKIVAFKKAPPDKPPSPAQNTQRYRFRQAVAAWHNLPSTYQADYERVTNRLSICMTGLNLWIHFALIHDWKALTTLQRQAGIVLFPPPEL